MKTILVAFGETVGVLFPLVNPIGNVPIFLALTTNQTHEARRHMARLAVLIAAGLLILFAAIGEPLLNFFGISREALQIAGGLVIGYAGFRMVTSSGAAVAAATQGESAAISPLAVPLLTGPGAMAAIIALNARDANVWLAFPGIVAGVLVIFALTYILFTLADRLSRFLPSTALIVLTLIFGLIVLSIGVEMVVHGIVTHGAVVKVRG